MITRVVAISALVATWSLTGYTAESSLPRAAWGAPPVKVTHEGDVWIISGKRNSVTLNETNLGLVAENGAVQWAMAPSGTNDMLVKAGGREFYVRLNDAKKIAIEPYDTGFKTGLKISLRDWA